MAKASVGEMPPLALTAVMSSNSEIFSLLMRAPDLPSRSSAEPKAALTVSSRPSSGRPCATPNRRPASGAGSSSTGSSPAITASALAQSKTVRRERADGIEREAQRERAVGRHALLAWLEADDAAERRRNAHRAAGVGADRNLAHAVADGHGRARRRAAGDARAVDRIAGRAEMRICADAGECEFAHVGLGDDHRAGGAQAPHHGRIGRGGRRLLGEDFGAGAGRFAGDIEQVLDADDRAVERPERHAGFRARVGSIGRRPRSVGVDGEAGTRALPVRIGDAGERPFEAVAGGFLRHDFLPRNTSPRVRGEGEG